MYCYTYSLRDLFSSFLSSPALPPLPAQCFHLDSSAAEPFSYQILVSYPLHSRQQLSSDEICSQDSSEPVIAKIAKYDLHNHDIVYVYTHKVYIVSIELPVLRPATKTLQ